MENYITKLSLTVDAAQKITAGAFEMASKLGINIAVAVVDESGVLKHFSRMDNSPLIAVSTSQKKALTAVGFGLPTGEAWHNFIKDDPILLSGAGQMDNFILLGGGQPIQVAGSLIGAVGVSGGHYKLDEQCAQAGLKAAGF